VCEKMFFLKDRDFFVHFVSEYWTCHLMHARGKMKYLTFYELFCNIILWKGLIFMHNINCCSKCSCKIMHFKLFLKLAKCFLTFTTKIWLKKHTFFKRELLHYIVRMVRLHFDLKKVKVDQDILSERIFFKDAIKL